MMMTLPTDQLARLIARKYEVLVQLRQTGLHQIELVNQGDVPTLLRVLAVKQQLISDLQEVERELAPYRNEDPDRRVWPTPEARAQCAQLAATCNDLLSEIVCLEKQSEDKMIARRDQVAQRLQQMYSASQARGAYAVHQAHRPTGPAAGSASRSLADYASDGLQEQHTPGGLNLVSEK